MIQVINRALDILEVLSQDLNSEYGLREIADGLKLNHGTCANIIKTMINRGYIEKKQGYSLGAKAYYLTNNFSNKEELLKVAKEPIKKLKATINESSILAILKNNARIVLYKEVSSHELQANTRDEKNAYMTATGRILLAFLDSSEQRSFVSTYGMPGKMWPEIKTEKDLYIELSKIKANGIALHRADSDIIGVGAPVHKRDKVVASIGVYLPETRFKNKVRNMILAELKITTEQTSKALSKTN